jgi:hypothetical protein
LFVFRSPPDDRLIFAVLGPLQKRFDTVIHAGSRSWLIRDGQNERGSDSRLFSGTVAWPRAGDQPRRRASLVEARQDAFPHGEELHVWAELRHPDGARTRVGSPLFAAYLAAFPEMAGVYHTSSPADDRSRFAGVVSDHIAQSLHGWCAADARAYGMRLAAVLLPDVIRFHPDRPTGFSFASRNGHHPADDVSSVTKTLLAGRIGTFASSMS